MPTTETGVSPSPKSDEPDSRSISRREFVERLGRAAIYVVPVAATVSLMTPKAMGYP